MGQKPIRKAEVFNVLSPRFNGCRVPGDPDINAVTAMAYDLLMTQGPTAAEKAVCEAYNLPPAVAKINFTDLYKSRMGNRR